MLRSTTGSVKGWLIVALAALSIAAGASPSPAKNQYVYSLSTRQQSSRLLGVTGVPAYVVTKGGSRRGLYITGVGNGGNWRNIGLQPGDLLISVDSRVMTDCGQADSALSSMSGGVKDVVLVRSDDEGRPNFLNVRANISPGNQSTIAPNPDGSGIFKPAGKSTSRESIAALESYLLNLVNQDRATEGLPPVSMNSTLSNIAREYAQYSVDHKIFAHTDDKGRDPGDRAAAHGVKVAVFENLAFQAYGWGSERDMISTSNRLMMAEPKGQQNHRGNIMGARKYVGIGIARNDGELMMVEEFTDTDP